MFCETGVICEYLSPPITSTKCDPANKNRMVESPSSLLLVAGSGHYPALVVREARAAGVKQLSLIAFDGETLPEVADSADQIYWMKVGQLGKFLDAAKKCGAAHAIMAGQLAPKNLFDLRPDLKALVALAKLKRRNAETLFGAVAAEMAAVGVTLLPATAYLENHLATIGHIAGPRPKTRQIEDLEFGYQIAKESSRLDIGQTVVVKNGTVLAVEAFEGTNECIKRGGTIGRGKSIMVKVSKPGQDMRFDVPVIGSQTLETCRDAGVSLIGIEAGRTLLLDKPALAELAGKLGITLFGLKD